MVDTAIPLSDALTNANGLTPNDATLRFAGRIKVFLNRLWLHAWPWWFVAGIGLLGLLGRAALRDRMDLTIPMLFVVVPITSIWVIVVARRVVVSKGAQLAVVALPPEAVSLLGVDYRRDMRDGGGTIPRHPLIASESGLQIDINGAHHDRPTLRERGISVELTASRSGLLSRCVLCLGERRVTVRVRGRLQLKRPVRSTTGDLINQPVADGCRSALERSAPALSACVVADEQSVLVRIVTRRRQALALIGSLATLTAVASGCSVESDGFAAVAVGADGGLIGLIQMCGHHVDGATLYRSDARDTPELGVWEHDEAVTDFASWALASPPSDWAPREDFVAPTEGQTYSLYGWTNDNSWSASHATFTLDQVANLKPGEVLYLDGLVTTESDFRAHVCDEPTSGDLG